MTQESASFDFGSISTIGAADWLSQLSGESITAAQIEDDVQRGAPVNRDGSLNLINYAAWCIRENLAYGD